MPDFKISAALEGHTDDVRAVAFPDPNTVLSASRDATVRVWKLTSTPPPFYDYTISSHGSAFINSLAYYPPSSDHPDGLIFSGGQDTIIEAREPGKPADANATAMLLGHSHNVCSIDVCPEGKWVVSGSWDSSAKLWKIGKWECEVTFEGHQGSVWAVLAFDQNTIVTGCADQKIRIYSLSGQLLRSMRAGDVVRALCKLPPNHQSGCQIASASNDGIIRLWTLQGLQVAELCGHESFIYALATLPSGEIVSSGEDRTVRIWSGDRCIQTITHPAISVWSIAVCQETGDIVSGASDRVTRVFSRAQERHADQSVIALFENSVKESSIPQQQVGNINKEKLPGPEFLKQKLGTKEGQVQMIRQDDGSVTAHTWATATREWISVGTVVDSAASSGRKVEYLGQDYDYVFDVDIEDGKPPLKLPYNLSQNPYEAATKFIQNNELPMGYLDQVANFITTNTQGASIGSSTTQSQGPPPPGADPWGEEKRYRPGDGSSNNASSFPATRPKVLPQTSYLAIKTANIKTIQKKVQELNEQLVSSGSKDISLSPSEVETVIGLCNQLDQTPPLKESPQVEFGIPLTAKIATTWPIANRLPGLDLLRLLAASTPAAASTDYGGSDLISALISSGVFKPPLNVNNAMLAIRTFANLFETDAGRALAISKFSDIMTQVGSLANAGGTPNRNLTIAIATLYINFSVFVTSDGRASSPESAEKALLLLDELGKLLIKEKDSEAIYRVLVALGTLVTALGEEVKTAAKEIYDINTALSKVISGGFGREPRVKSVVNEIRSALE
ncbi:ubiquitin homeostasis protein lub1 [Histoplasma capsulatum H143]|uniref:Ubiquitin homeostasis protein lub1 n=1 Tax=Ajellomyces capsulatus (strain H143) TaxID=544712 RepID=C6HFR8_AJECH|nr:ubiquitin homeostasis protein lub1 [Histoplasma capsulatum H143]